MILATLERAQRSAGPDLGKKQAKRRRLAEIFQVVKDILPDEMQHRELSAPMGWTAAHMTKKGTAGTTRTPRPASTCSPEPRHAVLGCRGWIL